MLFPGLMSDELLAKVPPMVVLGQELCCFIDDTKLLIERLKKAGKLKDSYVGPGGLHVQWMFNLTGTSRWFKDRKILHDKYVAA